MGLFRKLGRQVGEFTSQAKAAAEQHEPYRCSECGARFSEHHEECPECASSGTVSHEPES